MTEQTSAGPAGTVTPRRRRDGWHVARSAERFVLARHWPPRLDVSAGAAFGVLHRERLARQIRQDLWRRMRSVRGFSPVIQVDVAETGLYVTAGGRICSQTAVPLSIEAEIAALLSDPAHRARWSRWARGGGQA